VVGHNSNLRKEIIEWLHSLTTGGHSCINATMHKVKVVVYWKDMTKDIKEFVLHMWLDDGGCGWRHKLEEKNKGDVVEDKE